MGTGNRNNSLLSADLQLNIGWSADLQLNIGLA